MNSRALNHMDPDTRMIHARLEEWASWAKSGLQSIGWPPETILARMMDQGITGAANAGPPPITIPERIAIVDSAVSRLKPPDNTVIKAYYLNWSPTQALWKEAGLRSEYSFKIVLRRARWRIAGFVDCAERR